MENREIIVANTRTQQRSKIVTNATTLGELKRALDNADISYAGMTFTEGISKTQLLDDATQLPQNVLYKGQTTNNLVILLTNTNKKIESGIQAADRGAAYSIIKDYGFQEDIKAVFGRNFTQVPTADLQKFIEERTAGVSSEEEDDDYDENYDDEDYDEGGNACNCRCAEETEGQRYAHSVISTTLFLLEKGFLTPADVASIADTLKVCKSEPVSTSDGSINDNDIDDMINALN